MDLYYEMCVVSRTSHPNPKRALVIGGGDGGVLRELARYGLLLASVCALTEVMHRHTSLEEIVICELDAGVIAAAKKCVSQLDNAHIERTYGRSVSRFFRQVSTQVGCGLRRPTSDCAYNGWSSLHGAEQGSGRFITGDTGNGILASFAILQDYFDIIITDSSDPVGPASVLFEQPFYQKVIV